MYIPCPKCGRRGQLPDRWVPQAHSLRCRRCGALFKTPELARSPAEVGTGAAFDSVSPLGRGDKSSAFVEDGFFRGFDDELIAPREAGPGDSNYELTFTLRDAEGDSGPEWPAARDEVAVEAPSSDETPALTSSAAPAGPEPWPYRFIEVWGLRLIVAALILIGALIPTTAYLVWHTIRSGPDLGISTPALIAGFACVIAVLMIAVPLLLLAASLTEFARDLRRYSRQAEHHGLIARR